ncbi:autotransporter outer membrane beta-barrel domain-containing protein [Utexia brackfieldae]|uniref:autotransporter outer membrane beta-barrel domain-containing protein n=1 Tax=Utexia brackfieldae TaxID=3074108 RepID=UPI00370D80E3
MKNSRKLLTATITMILSTHYTSSVHATDYQPLNGGSIVLNDGDTVSSIDEGQKYGINVTTPTDSLTINGSADITVESDQVVNGVTISNTNTNDLGDGTSINTTGNGVAATGLQIGENTTEVKGTHLTINTKATGGYAYGINAGRYSQIDLGDSSVINTDGNALGIGIYGLVGSHIQANALNLSITNPNGYGIYLTNAYLDLGRDSVIKTDTADGGIQVSQSSSLKADNLTVITTGSDGINLQEGSTTDLGSNTTILTQGANTSALSAYGQNSLVRADHLSTTATGMNSYAIQASNGGTINVGAGSSVNTVQGDAISSAKSTINFLGSETERNTITIKAKMAVQSGGIGAQVNLANTDIQADNSANTDKKVIGLYANTNGVINAENTNLTMSGLAYSAYAQKMGKINLTGHTRIIANDDPGSLALVVNGDGSVINLDGRVNIDGNIHAEEKGLISANLTAGSLLNGKATLADASSEIDFTMDSSTWNVSDNSQVSSLNLNQSNISFTQTNRANQSDYVTLTTNSLIGNGTFDMRTDIVGQKGDLLTVNGQAQGTYQLNILNNGAASTSGNETLTVVKTTTNDADFSLANKVELGAYEYELRAVDGSPNNLELYSASSSNNGGGGNLTTTAKAATSFLNIGYFTNYIENQTLLQRLGDLRNGMLSGTQTNGLWLRAFGGKLDSFSDSLMTDFDMRYSGTQLGFDTPVSVAQGQLMIGAMVGYTQTDPNYQAGTGKNKNISAGIYATYLLDNGFYFDATFRYNNMRNNFNVYDTKGASVAGKGRTEGLSLSAEIGKRVWFADDKQGFYIEPQLQITYGYQHGDNINASNGLTIKLSDYNSVLGRVSGILGYQISGNNPVNVYVKTGLLSEMSGSVDYRFNGSGPNHYIFRSNWFNNGLGANISFSHVHHIYAEADYSTGHEFNNLMFNIGYRYAF